MYIMLKGKRLDAFVLIFFLILAPTISFVLKTSLLVSTIFFYGLPSIWLSFREPKNIKRAAIFSFLLVVLFFVVDYLAVQDGAWWVSSIFSYRFLGVLPIEDSIWVFLAIYVIVLFYKHFDDYEKLPIKHTHIKYFIAIVMLMVVIFATALLIFGSLYTIHYAYFWIGMLLGVMPAVIILYLFPSLRYKFLRAQLYIFCLHLSFEITALKLGQWSFPGNHFIGWVELLNVKFPIEEFIIWISMTAVIALSYYEFYYCDRK